jgi:hypothetical protein
MERCLLHACRLFNPDKKIVLSQFFYMWDDDAFYAAPADLDTKAANFARPTTKLWEGDGDGVVFRHAS